MNSVSECPIYPLLTLSNVNQACTTQSARSQSACDRERERRRAEAQRRGGAELVVDETPGRQEVVLVVFLTSAG
jgi:hypothetical protein